MEFPLFETLCIEGGEVKNIALHQQRYEQSLRRFYGKSAVEIFDILQLIEKTPEFSTALSSPSEQNLIRCRFDYNQADYALRFFPYQRKIYQTFQTVICDHIDYSLKYNNRDLLNELLAQRGDRDEIIIIKQGKVTDCAIGNLIFRRGKHWITPDSPLLNGTQRQYLLAAGRIREETIFAEDIDQFDEIRLINAMNGLSE